MPRILDVDMNQLEKDGTLIVLFDNWTAKILHVFKSGEILNPNWAINLIGMTEAEALTECLAD